MGCLWNLEFPFLFMDSLLTTFSVSLGFLLYFLLLFFGSIILLYFNLYGPLSSCDNIFFITSLFPVVFFLIPYCFYGDLKFKLSHALFFFSLCPKLVSPPILYCCAAPSLNPFIPFKYSFFSLCTHPFLLSM